MNLIQITFSVLSIFILVMYFQIISYNNFKIFSVTFKHEHAKDPATKSILKKCKIQLIVITLAFIGLTFITKLKFMLNYADAYIFLLFLAYMLGTMFILMRLQRSLINLKKAKGWIYLPETTQVVDLKVTREQGMTAPHKIWAWLIWLVSFLPLGYILLNKINLAELGFMFIVLPVFLVVIPLSYPMVLRQRLAAYSLDTQINQAIARKTERISGMTYLLIEAIVIIFQLIFMGILIFYPAKSMFFIYTVFGMIALMMVVLIWSNKALQKIESTLNQQQEVVFKEENHYKWGLYNNPADPRIMVPKRIAGMGMTVNIGNPKGKVIMWVIMLPVLVILLLVFNMMLSKIEVELDDTLSIKVPMYSAEVQPNEIADISLSETPLNGTRTNGFGGSTKQYGYFNLNEYGRTRLYVHSNVKNHIDIKLIDTTKNNEENSTSDVTTGSHNGKPLWVIVNQSTPEATEQLYEKLLKWWGK